MHYEHPNFLTVSEEAPQESCVGMGGMFFFDNCTLHFLGDCVGLQNTLFREYSVLMINLPPKLNSTELVFNTLLQRLTQTRAIYNSLDAVDFKHTIELVMTSFDLSDVLAFYEHSGYI